ncbi:MAG: hypothetical protein ACYC9L_03570 [Sulfuricaulis sp.]
METKMQIGSVIRVWHGLYFHKGVISVLFPQVMVVHNSKAKGRVVEEPLHLFAEGGVVSVEWSPFAHAAHAVVARARACLGRLYDVGQFNCEHHTEYAKGNTVESPQLTGWIVFGLVASALLIAAAAAR